MSKIITLAAAVFIRSWWGVAGLITACSGPKTSAQPAPQWAADSATVRLAAGPQYARSAVWQFFWGKHYRTLWATPVTVPVLRLATAAPGGLVPLQAGGSYQSHTLRLCAPSGREFVLRSVDKDASAALPVGWKRWLLGGLIKDQTSVSQPFGAYSAAALADAAGVYHANPRLVYVPDDPGLGKFRVSYANALYLLEERATGNQMGLPGFGHSPHVVSTAHMLAAIHGQPTARVEARAYLRARLLDMWLGDWSRREDQWRWASFTESGRVRYRPIPRDRDQAFFLFDDGFMTRLVSWFVPKYQSFHATIRPGSVDGLTATARVLDRTLLASLNAEDFQQEADSLRQRLTDARIDRALATGPSETRTSIANYFGPLLRARRAQLPAVARQYYEILAKEACVVGTDQSERFVISGAGAGRLRVRLLAQRLGLPDSLLSDRTYNQKETQRLNLYGLGGDDVFEIVPPLSQHFPVNIYSGLGHDQLIRPKTATMGIQDFTWFTRPGLEIRTIKGLTLEADPHPELTADGKAWLGRYNLND